MAAKSSSAVGLVIRDFDKARKHHDVFRQKIRRRYNAYRGILEKRSDAAQWTSKLHPPYILQVVETTVANIVDPNPRMRVRPRPKSLDSERLQQHLDGAKTLERLLFYEFDVDHFAEKQRPYVLQGLITGLSVGKCYWHSREGKIKSLGTRHAPIHDVYGVPIGAYSYLEEQEDSGYLHDDPCFEVIDARDFLWHEAAVSVERSPFLIHRTWPTFDELKELEREGLYKNVEGLRETRDFQDELSDRELELHESDRTKDRIELIEYWRKSDQRVITVANRSVLLSDRPWPFWHKEYPFVVTSSLPDLFRIPGISQVELLAELQEMLWTLSNQRIDNLSLINNAIILIRSDVDNPDDFEFAPGEKWMVEDPAQVTMWTPNPMSAEVSLSAEALIKGDIQNITGGMPFASGTESQTVDQKTATGVSIVASLAQRLLAAKKQHYMWAWKRVGEQFISLLQQFMRDPRLIEIIGSDGMRKFEEVSPEQVQGRYDVVIEPMTESLMRQERRAEAQAKLQVAIAAAPIMQAVGQPLNLKAFAEDYLEAFDVLDKERYFATAQPALPGGQPGSNQFAPPGQPGGNSLGVTAPQATDATSPSNQTSLSPEQFLQRNLAMRGGGRNF